MNEHVYETKTAGGDVSAAFDDFMGAFEAFKETNDERLGEIERRMSADVVTTDKLSRIDRAIDEQKRVIDELTHRATRPGLARNRAQSGAALQHKSAFHGYVRSGETATLRDLEGKALSVGSDPDGGYLVPDETETAINSALRDISPSAPSPVSARSPAPFSRSRSR